MSQPSKVPSITEVATGGKSTATAEEFRGTVKTPMPDDTPTVAGRPRHGRTITEPGDPGVITPEDNVIDTSQPNGKQS